MRGKMAAKKPSPMVAVLPRLYSTDLTILVRMAGFMTPRLLDGFFKDLNEKERAAFNKVMPPIGGKRFYVKLEGSPTPPILVELGQPLKIGTISETEVRKQGIRGLRLKCDDTLLLAGGMGMRNGLKFFWRLRGQWITTFRIMSAFMPLLRLGRSGMKDVQDKMNAKFGPLSQLFGM